MDAPGSDQCRPGRLQEFCCRIIAVEDFVGRAEDHNRIRGRPGRRAVRSPHRFVEERGPVVRSPRNELVGRLGYRGLQVVTSLRQVRGRATGPCGLLNLICGYWRRCRARRRAGGRRIVPTYSGRSRGSDSRRRQSRMAAPSRAAPAEDAGSEAAGTMGRRIRRFVSASGRDGGFRQWSGWRLGATRRGLPAAGRGRRMAPAPGVSWRTRRRQATISLPLVATRGATDESYHIGPALRRSLPRPPERGCRTASGVVRYTDGSRRRAVGWVRSATTTEDSYQLRARAEMLSPNR